jgi:HEAT repeat protein
MSSNPPESADNERPLPADEMLPPVEPPNASFLLQLFVVPAVIVAVVVCLWMLVTSLASSDSQDPEKIVAALRGSNQNRWQQAYELASMLQIEKRYPKLKRNTELAAELAKLLDEEIDAEQTDENSVKLRCFLCSALGSFQVEEGLDVLLKAARDDVERDVRRDAINAIAIRAQQLAAGEEPRVLEHPELVETFVGLANQTDDLIRSQTAYALGVITQPDGADPRLSVELEKLADDLYADARYNAALALARQGNLLAVDAIAEMFDPDALAISIAREEIPTRKTHKRNTILHNALGAVEMMQKKNPQVDLPELRTAVERFVETAPEWEHQDTSLEALVEHGRELLERQASE